MNVLVVTAAFKTLWNIYGDVLLWNSLEMLPGVLNTTKYTTTSEYAD